MKITPENKKKALGAGLVIGAILLYHRYGNEPKVKGSQIEFDNVPMKTLSVIIGIAGLYILLKKPKINL